MQPIAEISLPAILDLGATENWYASQREYLLASAEHGLRIQAGKVERLSAAGVQMLLSLQKTFAKHNQNLVFNTMSEEFRAAVTSLGVHEQFQSESEVNHG